MVPTVTFRSNCSPVLPSHNSVCPDEGKSANLSSSATSSTDAPSKTGVAIGNPFEIFSTNSKVKNAFEKVFSKKSLFS